MAPRWISDLRLENRISTSVSQSQIHSWAEWRTARKSTALIGLVWSILLVFIFSVSSFCHSRCFSLLPSISVPGRILAWLRSLPPKLLNSSQSPTRRFMLEPEPKEAAGKQPSCLFCICELILITERYSCFLVTKYTVQSNTVQFFFTNRLGN